MEVCEHVRHCQTHCIVTHAFRFHSDIRNHLSAVVASVPRGTLTFPNFSHASTSSRALLTFVPRVCRPFEPRRAPRRREGEDVVPRRWRTHENVNMQPKRQMQVGDRTRRKRTSVFDHGRGGRRCRRRDRVGLVFGTIRDGQDDGGVKICRCRRCSVGSEW